MHASRYPAKHGEVDMCYDKPIDLFKMRYVMSAATIEEVDSLMSEYINNFVFVLNGLNKFNELKESKLILSSYSSK